MWLADTAHPLNRTALLTLPAALPSVTWLADLAWTGPNSFIALGQVFASFPHCGACFSSDSVFINAPGTVVVGTITGDHATLQPVTGTDGATAYSLAEGGASIVFMRRDDAKLYKVPVGGGTAVATQTGRASPIGRRVVQGLDLPRGHGRVDLLQRRPRPTDLPIGRDRTEGVARGFAERRSDASPPYAWHQPRRADHRGTEDLADVRGCRRADRRSLGTPADQYRGWQLRLAPLSGDCPMMRSVRVERRVAAGSH